jgi:sugar phosphate isomerase/epimerase
VDSEKDQQKETSMNKTITERLGCSTITFRHQTLFEALDEIVGAGLKKVDIACIPGFCPHINPMEFTGEEEKELQDRLQALGLTVSTLNVSAGGLNMENKDFVYSFIEASIHLAARLGCYAVTIPSGRKIPDPALWEENARTSAKYIRDLAKIAENDGVLLTLEAPHPGTLAETVDESNRFFQVLNDRGVACTFDTSHVARGNPSPVERCVSEIGANIGHVHFRDCIGENNHLTPGKGAVDFGAVIKELDHTGYPGDFILELEGEDRLLAADELAFAIRHIRSLEG